ncbi:Bug family tripartite tricarboxylate transporter substrate binding protein [Parapusillimonas granuli]|uniref:Tripartite tricarboxylate transporter substrate binding protein n=1 Tax=Parapusillimonas granuli TaxID=380911 RepID=A0A853FUS5_9BURK|nr:tripartite tricarboxylate transporter substrate-binding protein [Parapusillimonas granuli]MBB5215609.1 tripartite-type tricarboxylate transporter receptor subunit TctC [Parapusillimonas granuli]NYT49724.1 tripartite tricarboxylate transporter substrate binding protein [Parapusillimonas granuli]
MRLLVLMGGMAIATSGLASQPIESFPSHPVKLVVPFSPGGSVDITGRSISQRLGELLKVPVVVENRPGVAAVIGTQSVVNAKPDGYTLLVGSTSLSIRPHLDPPLPFNPNVDLMPITLAANVSHVLMVSPELGVKNVADLVKLYEKRKTPILYGDVGQGSLHYLAGELFKRGTGIEITHISYKGTSNMLTDLLGAHVELASIELSVAGSYIKSGRLIPIGLAAMERNAEWPDLPTIAEQGVKDYEITSWFGFLAPAGTPEPIVNVLNAKMVEALADPQVKEAYANAGLSVVGSTVEYFKNYLAAQDKKWGGAIKSSARK